MPHNVLAQNHIFSYQATNVLVPLNIITQLWKIRNILVNRMDYLLGYLTCLCVFLC